MTIFAGIRTVEKYSKLKKIMKRIGCVLVYLGALILALVIAVQLFVAYYPSFGGDVTKQRQELYANSAQFEAAAPKTLTLTRS